MNLFDDLYDASLGGRKMKSGTLNRRLMRPTIRLDSEGGADPPAGCGRKAVHFPFITKTEVVLSRKQNFLDWLALQDFSAGACEDCQAKE